MEQGYTFEFHSLSVYLNDKGRIIKIPEKNMEVSYQIIYNDPKGNSESKIYTTKIIVDDIAKTCKVQVQVLSDEEILAKLSFTCMLL